MGNSNTRNARAGKLRAMKAAAGRYSFDGTTKMANGEAVIPLKADHAWFQGHAVWLIKDHLAMGPPAGYPTYDNSQYMAEATAASKPTKKQRAKIFKEKNTLEGWVAAIKSFGVTWVYSFQRYDAAWTAACSDGELGVSAVQLKDHTTPDRRFCREHLHALVSILLNGQVVYMQCASGHGRTSMMACLLLQTLLDVTAAAALQHVVGCFLRKGCACDTCLAARAAAAAGELDDLTEVQPEEVHQRKFVTSPTVTAYLTHPQHVVSVGRQTESRKPAFPAEYRMSHHAMYAAVSKITAAHTAGRGIYNTKDDGSWEHPYEHWADPSIASLLIRKPDRKKPSLGVKIFGAADGDEHARGARRGGGWRELAVGGGGDGGGAWGRRRRRRQQEEEEDEEDEEALLEALGREQRALRRENRALRAQMRAVRELLDRARELEECP